MARVVQVQQTNKGSDSVLFLTRQLNLRLKTGDRVDITVVDSESGVTLGIVARERRSVRKVIVPDQLTVPGKFRRRRPVAPAPVPARLPHRRRN